MGNGPTAGQNRGGKNARRSSSLVAIAWGCIGMADSSHALIAGKWDGSAHNRP